MNITLGSGKVHSAVVLDDYAPFPLCGGNKSVGRYSETAAEVDCQRCLKRLAKRAEQPAVQDEDERVAEYKAEVEARFEGEPTEDERVAACEARIAASKAEKCGEQLYDPFRGLAYCVKDKHHSRVVGGPEHLGNYDEMDELHREALAMDAAQAEVQLPEALDTATEDELDEAEQWLMHRLDEVRARKAQLFQARVRQFRQAAVRPEPTEPGRVNVDRVYDRKAYVQYIDQRGVLGRVSSGDWSEMDVDGQPIGERYRTLRFMARAWARRNGATGDLTVTIVG